MEREEIINFQEKINTCRWVAGLLVVRAKGTSKQREVGAALRRGNTRDELQIYSRDEIHIRRENKYL